MTGVQTCALPIYAIINSKGDVLFESGNVTPVSIMDIVNNKADAYFYIEKQLTDDVYEDVPLVLVTNKEVYDYLKEHDCPLHVEHWALSYPDQYRRRAVAVQTASRRGS